MSCFTSQVPFIFCSFLFKSSPWSPCYYLRTCTRFYRDNIRERTVMFSLSFCDSLSQETLLLIEVWGEQFCQDCGLSCASQRKTGFPETWLHLTPINSQWLPCEENNIELVSYHLIMENNVVLVVRVSLSLWFMLCCSTDDLWLLCVISISTWLLHLSPFCCSLWSPFPVYDTMIGMITTIEWYIHLFSCTFLTAVFYTELQMLE